MSIPGENVLLRLLGQGNKNAFAELYRQYIGKVSRFVLCLTKDEAVAKDISHDIFMKIWEQRDVVSKVGNFNSYIFRMTKNTVLNHFEKNAIRDRYFARKELCREEFRDLVDEKVSANELQMIIMSAITKMPEQRRNIFTLSRFKGVSNPDIAALFGISIRTVETHISHALSDIRAVIAENYG